MQTSPASGPPGSRPPAGRIVVAVLGGLMVVLGLGAAGIGTFLTWAHTTQRDDDGFYRADLGRLDTLTHALVSEEVDLGSDDFPHDLGGLATVRLDVAGAGERALFAGIAPDDDVDRYLAGVSHARISESTLDPFTVRYEVRDGGAPRSRPGDEDFWVARTGGVGPQVLRWEPTTGRFAVVIMNADGSPGVGADASVGVEADWVLPVGIGLLVGGVLALAVGAGLLVAGAHGVAAAGPAVDGPSGASPVRLEGRLDATPRRWLWLVKWLLLVPHFVALAILWAAMIVLTAAAAVAILFTGRYPARLFDFNTGVLRWTWRVGFYSFGAFATDRYPPFTLRPAAGYPASLDVARPERLSRGLVLVKWWLLAIPHYVVVGLLVGAGLGRGDGLARFGLIGWLALVAAVIVLFAARYPARLFDLLMGLNRWVFRVLAYVLLMTDAYPPFRLDQGPAEPQDPVPAGAGA